MERGSETRANGLRGGWRRPGCARLPVADPRSSAARRCRQPAPPRQRTARATDPAHAVASTLKRGVVRYHRADGPRPPSLELPPSRATLWRGFTEVRGSFWRPEAGNLSVRRRPTRDEAADGPHPLGP